MQANLKTLRTAFRPSRGNLGPLILCLGVIAVFLFAFLLPRILHNEELARTIDERTEQVQIQQDLHPVHRELLDILTEPLPKGLEQNQFSGPEVMGLEEAAPRLREMAESSALNVRFIRPDATALARDGLLLVDCSLSGEMYRMWDFLRILGTHPWLLDVQNMEISSGQDGEEFRMRLLIAMDKE